MCFLQSIYQILKFFYLLEKNQLSFFFNLSLLPEYVPAFQKVLTRYS